MATILLGHIHGRKSDMKRIDQVTVATVTEYTDPLLGDAAITTRFPSKTPIQFGKFEIFRKSSAKCYQFSFFGCDLEPFQSAEFAIQLSLLLKMHYETTHKDFHTEFPPGSEMSPCYGIAHDESCDLIDSEQMSIFVRFFDIENKVFREELLTVLTFKGKTRGEDLLRSFDDIMTKSDLNYDKIVSISTNGAPAIFNII
ncbi:Hypothetical protein CINCED_3A002488 [Cinara cedri]|uniref:Uncharacterized protein n=1 Tax=Cinara cedri TaxID=506608 RepID=A0A5E4NN86_9HEMI|nr:Hypothetical protein CINCED_3A002488 [Cinara cedri]